MATRPNIGAENWKFLNLLTTMIVGALRLRQGLLSIKILCFLKSDKNEEVRSAKVRTLSKNNTNWHITLPNFNIFQ